LRPYGKTEKNLKSGLLSKLIFFRLPKTGV
jgi:hypothetical protein